MSLHKVIIITECCPDDQSDLQTTCIETNGMRVDSVLYVDDIGSIMVDEERVKADLKDELYADMYDEDELKIKVKEAYDGSHVAQIIAKYLSKLDNPNEDLQIYFYKPEARMFKKLLKELENIDGRLYLSDYNDIFNGEEPRDIKELMRDKGMKTDYIVPGSQLSFGYFLSTLIELLISR